MTSRPLPDHLRPLIEGAIKTARKKLEAGRELPGLAFIDAPHGGPESTGMHGVEVTEAGNSLIVIPMVAAPSKDAWARLVRLVTGWAESRFVMVVSEVWMRNRGDTKEDFEALMQQYGQVRLMPGAKEALLVQVETHDGFWHGIADVVPFPASANKDAKTFGALDFNMADTFTGRLVGLLAPKAGATRQ